jgi:hypothetical protein
MPVLLNPKHEVFCHIVAKGNPVALAFRVAGLPGDKNTAEKLVHQPLIAERIAELRPHYKAKKNA